jgi:hypothetical protein
MKAGHENKRDPWYVTNGFGTHLNNLAGFGAGRQVLIDLAYDFACMAADAFSGILKQVVVTHWASGV